MYNVRRIKKYLPPRYDRKRLFLESSMKLGTNNVALFVDSHFVQFILTILSSKLEVNSIFLVILLCVDNRVLLNMCIANKNTFL